MNPSARLTFVWIALSVLTALSWWVGDTHGRDSFHASLPITLAVLAMALIKIRLVIRDFMEVRTAPIWLGLWTDLWLATLFAGVLLVYLR